MKKNKIYIAPANHANLMADKIHYEKYEAEKIARIVVDTLDEKYDCTAVYPTVFSSRHQYYGRPEEAKRLNCDYYIAIHSDGCNGRYNGAHPLYHLDNPASLKLAKALFSELNLASGISVTMPRPIRGYRTQYGELRLPQKYGITPVIIETEFHDNLKGTKYIVNNYEKIAAAIVKAVAQALNLEQKSALKDVNLNENQNSETKNDPPQQNVENSEIIKQKYSQGDKITIILGAKYINNKSVPTYFCQIPLTVQKACKSKVLVKELFSWVSNEFLTLISKSSN
ncbi:MAG: N-acetylmuramoyl-L-alanine amidase [Clostridia bacterium]